MNHSDELSQATAQFINELAGHYNQANSKILDFGCGTGNLTNYVQELFWYAKVIGVDQSLSGIKNAQEEFNSIHFQSIDNALPFADQTFDLVYSAFVFHHVAKKQREYWINELVRVTKKNGTLIIIEFNPFHLPTLIRFFLNKEEKGAQIMFPRSLGSSMKRYGNPTVHYYPASHFSSSLYAVQLKLAD